MLHHPFVSICVPAYQYPDLLLRNLQSILSQSFTSFEVIVTDDSDHDKLKLVVEELGDERIRYFKNQPSLGSPANWNEGIKHATGSWIKMMHHDDWFSNDQALQSFVDEVAKNASVDFVFSNFNKSTPKGIFPNKLLNRTYLQKIAFCPSTLLYLNGIGAPSTTMFRHKKQNILFDINSKWYVDVLFYGCLLRNGSSVSYIRQPLLNVTAASATQVTANTNGLVKVKEALYAFKEFGYFKKGSMPLLLFIHFIELFRRYHIKADQFIGLEDNKLVQAKLKTALWIARIPINYRFLASVRVFVIKYVPTFKR